MRKYTYRVTITGPGPVEPQYIDGTKDVTDPTLTEDEIRLAIHAELPVHLLGAGMTQRVKIKKA